MYPTKTGRFVSKLFICGLFCLSAEAYTLGQEPVSLATPDGQAWSAWSDSPYRNFGPAQDLLAGRVLLFDEAPAATARSLATAVGLELTRLAAELHKEGWRDPFAEGDPLRVYIARKEAGGVARLASKFVDRGRLAGPAIQLDATTMADRQILRELAKLFALATLRAYGAPDRTFVTAAAADYLSGPETSESAELAREAAAAPSLDLSGRAAALGRLYIDEFARAGGGPASLRPVFERASETREDVASTLAKAFAELSGGREDGLLLRFAARLYATVESEASPSRIGLLDLEDGGLDSASPAAWTIRHRAVFPSAAHEAGTALRVRWPDDGAPAAAVLRYRDGLLPPDVIFFSPGDSRVVPLSGVARMDWVVAASAGAGASGSPLSAPAAVEMVAGLPFEGLSAKASAGSEGPRVEWTTRSHEGLAGWAIFREEVQPDGRIARTGPEILPSSDSAEESFRYVYMDPATSPGTFYRYTVWAVTGEGALSRAFSATLRTAD